MSQDEEEYIEFLEEFGHIDFSGVGFAPLIKVKSELMQIRDMLIKNNVSQLKNLTQTNGNFDVLNRHVYKFDDNKIRDLHIENVEFEITQCLKDDDEVVKSSKFNFIFNNSLDVEDLNIDGYRLESFSPY